MNLGLHGILLQVILSIVQFHHGFRLCIAGEPGYLDFDNLPETNFSCQGKVIGGYYADVEAGCQMFHVCTIGQKDEIMDIKFLCLNGTVFDQETRVCERVDEVDCSKSEKFYNLNLELYGNHAVTLSLHESGIDDEDDPTDLVEEHESQRTTSPRPTTTSSTTTTTPRPSISSTTSASGPYQHPSGYPQHYQPQPRFPTVQTSQSKSLYDDKNGGYHHQYIFHTGDHRSNDLDNNNHENQNNNDHRQNNNNNQATSYQLFSNQGVSSTTGAPQIHQIRYSSTPATQIQIHNDHQPTVSPIFHATSSTIQTLLNSNANSPALINPIFHNHGIASTTEQFTVHNNNPRETDEYHDDDQGDRRDDNREDRRPLEAIQPTAQGKVSKLTITPILAQGEADRADQQEKHQQQQRITTSFLPTPSSGDGQAVRSFYPTPRTSTKSSSSHVTHIHVPPPLSIPHLKPHQITINLQTPDIQRIVQNPSPLLPSQSRVIVTAKASVSDESGRPLNTTQLVTLPLPTIPASYDDYKEGDESFDPFYRDVPKIRNDRRAGGRFRWPIRNSRDRRSLRIRRDSGNWGNIEDATKTKEPPRFLTDEVGAKKGERLGREDAEGKRSDDEEKEIKDIEHEKFESTHEERKYMNAAKVLSSRYSADISENSNSKATIEEKTAEAGYGAVENDPKSMLLNHPLNPEEIVNKTTIETNERIGSETENEARKDIEVLETMSTRHHPDSHERVGKKSAIHTEESNEEEYEDDARAKSAEIDAEEYINDSDETFDRKMFDELESQTSKDIDTRAVGLQTSKYSNDETNNFEREKTRLKHDRSYGLGVTKRGPVETSSRFSLLPEVVSSKKSQRKPKTKRLRERIPADEEESEEWEGDQDEVVKPRKAHRKSSAKKSKRRERVLSEEEVQEEDDDVFRPRKSHRKHSSRYSKTAARIPTEEKEESLRSRKSYRNHSARRSKSKPQIRAESEEEEEEDYEEESQEEIVKPRKSQRNRSSKSKARIQATEVPEDEEEEEEEEEDAEDDEGKENSNLRNSHRKHSTKKSKSTARRPPAEEERFRRKFGVETQMSYEEASSENYDDYGSETDSTSARSNEEDSTELFSESPNKISHPSKNKSFIEESPNRGHGKNRPREDHDYDFTDGSTTQSSGEVTSTEIAGDYVDRHINKSPEDYRELYDDEGEALRDDTTENSKSEIFDKVPSSTKTLESPKEATNKEAKSLRLHEDEHMSEGVLKFTDEIPSTERIDEPEEFEESQPAQETPHDYIDDNYEPQSYKEHHESSFTTESAATNKMVEKETATLRSEVDKYVETISTTTSTLTPMRLEEIAEKQNDEAQLEDNSSRNEAAKMDKSIERPIGEIASSTSTPTISTSSTTTTTTARSTTTKPFKPFPLRKNYVYIPPTTTPVPVIIKQRLPLTNPKPAKPPKSYNELAPKPIIRKSPLFARKTPIQATPPLDDPEATTELFVGTTVALLPDETTPTASTTLLPTSDLLETSSQETATASSPKEDEKSISNEDHASSSTTEALEFLPKQEIRTFTPYPLLQKWSEATAATEEENPPEEEAAEEESVSTTHRVDAENNNVPSVSEPGISTTTTEKATASVPDEASTENYSSTSQIPVTDTTTASTILRKNVSTDKPELEILYYTTIRAVSSGVVTENPEIVTTLKTAAMTSARAVSRKPGGTKRTTFFNCLEKEMYRFYADSRDCRLFHYCSPGFTARQVLDFRFVCEEGTAFDEESQSCFHDVKGPKCRKRVW